jgi:glycosyltransferase involved in cell wall biosynthesis
LILYVGGMSPHKNLHGLLRALARLSAQSTLNWHAALVGEYSNDAFLGCHDELARSCREFGLNGRVTFTGFVPNDRLVALYNDAAMLVLPSFSEGFGLPVVEAMACGLPVAVSHCGSLPEVAGSAAMMFDPHNPDEIAGVLGRLLANSDLRGALRYQGLQRVKRFSWNLAARRTMELFEETVCAANASA